MSKKLLLINDMAGYGKVALSAMIPVLSHMKYEVFNLPTAIVSNTLDYGKFDILDTTDYMKNAIAVWEQLGFEFDAISTGFIVSKEQTQLVTEFCKARAQIADRLSDMTTRRKNILRLISKKFRYISREREIFSRQYLSESL